MKTAISIQDDLLQQADHAARRMGLSRSRLFSVAIEEYLRQRQAEDMLAQLNSVYAKPDREERRLAGKIKSKFQSRLKDRW